MIVAVGAVALALTFHTATSSLAIESPDRDTFLDLDPTYAAAAGAAVAGGAAAVVTVVGAALTLVSPAFAILPLVATITLPVACSVSAVFAANLSENAMNVGLATGAAVIGGAALGGGVGFVVGGLVDNGSGDATILAVWASAFTFAVAAGALGAGVATAYFAE